MNYTLLQELLFVGTQGSFFKIHLLEMPRKITIRQLYSNKGYKISGAYTFSKTVLIDSILIDFLYQELIKRGFPSDIKIKTKGSSLVISAKFPE